MTDPTERFELAAEFPATTPAQWRTLVDAALKGAAFEKRLVSRTYDGLAIQPLYPRAENAQPVAGRAAVPWQVMQRVDHTDPAAANAEALHDLENGATGLTLVFGDAVGAYGYGLDGSQAALARVLDGIYLDAGIPIECELSSQARDVPLQLSKLLAERGIDPASTNIRAGFDPLGLMARRGATPAPWSAIAPLFAGFIRELVFQGWRGPFAVADGRPVHAAGGTEVQELAFVLGNAVAYLRALESAGIPLDDARRMIFFRLAADDDQFVTMPKFRALRKLWARVEETCGLTPERTFVSAETAWRMMTKRDPHANMLRTTIAVTAAGLAGADAITALPFTQALGLPDRFARRNARNTQLVLLEESNLAKVTDPAAGSGGIEDLTTQLCFAAWALLQEIEAAGGAAEAIIRGVIQNKVAAARVQREKAVATRREPLTGSSDFPNLSEGAIAVFDAAPFAATALAATITFPLLPSYRMAEPYERLRDASDGILKQSGSRPKVFLANLGKPSDFTARTTFARNFYEAGGIAAIGNDGFVEAAPGEAKTNIAALVSAFGESGARLACLCSSDELYAREAIAAAIALTAAGAIVHLAGRPGELEPAYRQAGVQDFIYAGCNVLATLNAAYDNLGIHDR